MNYKKKTISSINVLRALGSIFVLLIHVPAQNNTIRDYLIPIVSLAVPIFFISSGYFLYVNDRDTMIKKTTRNVFKFLRLFLSVSFLYFIIGFPEKGWVITSFAKFKDFIFFGKTFCGVLWFLLALVYTNVIINILCRIEKIFNIYILILLIISIPITVIQIVSGGYCYHFGIDPRIYFVYLLSVLGAIPFVTMGICLKRYESSILKIFKGKSVSILLLLSVIAIYFEYLYILHFNAYMGYFVSTPITSFLLFTLALKHKNITGGVLLQNLATKHSANIYYFHLLVYDLLSAIPFCQEYMNNNSISVLVFIVVILLSSCINWIQDRMKINVFR